MGQRPDGRKLALVTGAAAGIGRACVRALARSGYAVLAVDVAPEPLAETLAGLEGPARAAVCDLSDDAALEALFARPGDLAGLSLLVHSAGLFPRISFAETTAADLDRVMAVNFRAAVRLAQLAFPHLAKPGGRTVFLTSGAGLASAVADPMQVGFALYGASKAALDRWALGVAVETAPLGVAIDTITPGAFVHTPGLARLGLAEAEQGPAITAERVAEAIAWLASQPSTTHPGDRLSAAAFGTGWGPSVG